MVKPKSWKSSSRVSSKMSLGRSEDMLLHVWAGVNAIASVVSSHAATVQDASPFATKHSSCSKPSHQAKYISQALVYGT